jgi:hypothetical protein
MFLALAGITGYCAASAYQRFRQSKAAISRVDTTNYSNVIVIHKPRWLCPKVDTVVIGFKGNYMSVDGMNKIINETIKPNNETNLAEVIDTLKQFKPEQSMENIAYRLANDTPKADDVDGEIIYTGKSWVFPSIIPGGLSVCKFKRVRTNPELSFNQFVYTGVSRVWPSTEKKTDDMPPPITLPPP